jgi:hypothetical protein
VNKNTITRVKNTDKSDSPYKHKTVDRIRMMGEHCWEIVRWECNSTGLLWYVVKKQQVFGVVYLENGRVVVDDNSGVIPKFVVSYCEKLLRK